jgi:hypothetical protein
VFALFRLQIWLVFEIVQKESSYAASLVYADHADVNKASLLREIALESIGSDCANEVCILPGVLVVIPKIALYLGYDCRKCCKERS